MTDSRAAFRASDQLFSGCEQAGNVSRVCTCSEAPHTHTHAETHTDSMDRGSRELTEMLKVLKVVM